MKQQEFKQNINEIKKLSSKFPKTLNEALNFNEMENDDEMPYDEEEPMNEPKMEEPVHKVANNPSEKARKLIDYIRKMSLKAMSELADTPQCPEYEALKRIWQLTDKAVNEKEEQKEIMNKQNGLH